MDGEKNQSVSKNPEMVITDGDNLNRLAREFCGALELKDVITKAMPLGSRLVIQRDKSNYSVVLEIYHFGMAVGSGNSLKAAFRDCLPSTFTHCYEVDETMLLIERLLRKHNCIQISAVARVDILDLKEPFVDEGYGGNTFYNALSKVDQ